MDNIKRKIFRAKERVCYRSMQQNIQNTETQNEAKYSIVITYNLISDEYQASLCFT
jgi:hypothetical protein